MSPPRSRQAWVDNLRTLMIVFVVNMHACVTYSHVGGWYRMEDPEPPMSVKVGFMFWQGHLQAFFMGLLFFLAGVFAQRSLARRGPRAFVVERALRLGLPSALYMLVIHPFMVFGLLGHPHVADRPSFATLYLGYLTSGRVLSGNGPMWFALALLVFCLVLAGIQGVRSTAGPEPTGPAKAPSTVALLGFGVGLVLATFLVRIWQPIGKDILNFQMCFFPQYIAAFAVGVIGGRQGWLERLVATPRARVAGWLGLLGGPAVLAALVTLGGPPPEHGENPYAGGWHLRALGLAAWEQMTGLGLALGAMAWFAGRFNVTSPLWVWLAERSFGVYLLHAPILVALTPLFRPLPLGPFGHMLLLTVVGLAASYVAANIARRIPGLRAIL